MVAQLRADGPCNETRTPTLLYWTRKEGGFQASTRGTFHCLAYSMMGRERVFVFCICMHTGKIWIFFLFYMNERMMDVFVRTHVVLIKHIQLKLRKFPTQILFLVHDAR